MIGLSNGISFTIRKRGEDNVFTTVDLIVCLGGEG